MNSPAIDALDPVMERLADSIDGLGPAELTAFPVPGTWSIQQIVMHLGDSEAVHTMRIKWILAEENPTLFAWDETRWAKALHYDAQSVDDAMTCMWTSRRQLIRILRCLPESALARTGRHTERGIVTVAQLVGDLKTHVEHHLKFIHQKRALLGKPLK